MWPAKFCAMSTGVRVLNVTHLHPDQPPASSSSPAPHGDHLIKLCFLDASFVTKAPIQRLFFYEGPDLPPFPSLVRSLQSSLAATLAVYPPLAGKLTRLPSCDDVVIDCSPAAVFPGVKFVEAEYSDEDGAVDMHRLASDDEHHAEVFSQLIPQVEAGRLPVPVLAVQVTRPAAGNGGEGAVAVGVSIHHAVADGLSSWRFMKAWAAACREGSPAVAPGHVPPIFDRAAIRHPRAEELTRKFLRMLAAEQPAEDDIFSGVDVRRQSRRTFLLRANQIQSLKQRISQSKTGSEIASKKKPGSEQLSQPASTYVAVSSLVWTSLVCAKSPDDDNDAYFLLSADCRRRLRPPVDEAYFGNCIMGCCARATVGDLGGGDGLAHAAAAIQKAIREDLEDPLADVEGRLERRRAIPKERTTVMGSSNRFMAYETDFGWGVPSRVELVTVFVREQVTLFGARDGGVQVSVVLARAHMEAFATNFRQALEAATDVQKVITDGSKTLSQIIS